MARLTVLACTPHPPPTHCLDSAESLDSKIHEVDTAALSVCDARLFLLSVQAVTFPHTAHINTLLHCRGLGTAVAPALLCASSLVWLDSSTVTDTSQLKHVLAVGRPYELPRITLHNRPIRCATLGLIRTWWISGDFPYLRDLNPSGASDI